MFDFGLYTQVSDSGPHGPLVFTYFSLSNHSLIIPVVLSGALYGNALNSLIMIGIVMPPPIPRIAEGH